VTKATITGESMPVEKLAGDQVFAGTINQSGALEIAPPGSGAIPRSGASSKRIERAPGNRAPLSRKRPDRLAVTSSTSHSRAPGFTFLVTRDARALSPSSSWPALWPSQPERRWPSSAASGRAARIGSIIKGGVYLEALGRVQTVVLDKTGTLTLGKPEVAQVLSVSGTTVLEVLETAAIAENRSSIRWPRPSLRRARYRDARRRRTGHVSLPAWVRDHRVARRSAESWWKTVPSLAQQGVDATSLAQPTDGRQRCWVARSAGDRGDSSF